MMFRRLVSKRLAVKSLPIVVILWLLYQLSKHPTDNQTAIWTLQHRTIDSLDNTNLSLEEDCEPLHITIVCTGSRSTREMVTLIKSILVYRKHHLHLHFLVDKQSKIILGTLFRTWNLPSFVVSLYLIEDHVDKVSWIPNSHYAGVYGLIKLLIPNILPSYVKKVIVLDTDIVFSSDLFNLWQEFMKFKKSECIGLVENQSDWYFGTVQKDHKPWPALGRGYNSGVMLLDCNKLRLLGWQEIWYKVTKQHLKELRRVDLADQDILNAIIKMHPSIVHVLPCVWNLQLSDHMKFDLCYLKNNHRIKAVHWNFIKTRKKKYKHVELFSSIRSHFLELNGALLRKTALVCPDDTTNIMENIEYNDDDICSNLVANNVGQHRTQLFYFQYDYRPIKNDVCIVVHLSIDRLQMLEILSANWDGPMTVAIFLSDFDTRKVEVFVESSPILRDRKNIAFHFVFQNTVEDVYPINLLRNIALQQAVTDFVLLYDIDFVPMNGLYSYILSHLSETMHQNLTAYVIPAFESLLYKNKNPSTKSELLTQWKTTREILPFRESVWPQGHAATDFTRWGNTNIPYEIKWEKDFEPYVVISKDKCPLYDKRFIGYGWNKVSHIMELDAMGFRFFVLPHGFVIHIPHLPSIELQKYRTLPEYRLCMNDLKLSFIEMLMDKYHVRKDKYKMFMEEY